MCACVRLSPRIIHCSFCAFYEKIMQNFTETVKVEDKTQCYFDQCYFDQHPSYCKTTRRTSETTINTDYADHYFLASTGLKLKKEAIHYLT